MSGPAPTTRPATRGRVLATLAALAFAGALALAPASAASAHDYLVDSTPAAGSTVTKPLQTVSLSFNDVVLDLSGNGSSSLVQVTGPNAGTRHFETGCATTEGRVVTVPVALGAPGTYTIEWQIVSADGHTVSSQSSKSLQFSYQPPAGTTEAAGSTSRPSCGAGGSGPSDAATAPPTNETSDAGNLGIVVGIAGGIIGLAVIAVVIVLVTARRRPKDAEPWHPDEE